MSAFTEADERMLQELLAKKEREKQALEDIEAGKEQEQAPNRYTEMIRAVDKADIEKTLTGDTSGRVPERTTAQRMRDFARRAAGAASKPSPLTAGLKKSIAEQPTYIGRKNPPTEQPHSLMKKKDK